MCKIIKIDDVFYFDAEDGTEVQECKVWLEKSKASETHPEGKPWIKLPKDNASNRQYVSLDLFNETNINDEMKVEVKVGGPRVLGSTGVNQKVIKYLSEEEVVEYTNLVENAVAKFKEAKANVKTKKPEEMTIEELQEYINALKNGTTLTVKDGPKSFMEMFTEEEYNRYNELLAISAENKANAPRVKRGPMSAEEKAARKAKVTANKLSKAEELLAALLANQ